MCLESWFSHAGLMNRSHFKEYGECGSCIVLARDCCYAGNSYCEYRAGGYNYAGAHSLDGIIDSTCLLRCRGAAVQRWETAAQKQ